MSKTLYGIELLIDKLSIKMARIHLTKFTGIGVFGDYKYMIESGMPGIFCFNDNLEDFGEDFPGGGSACIRPYNIRMKNPCDIKGISVGFPTGKNGSGFSKVDSVVKECIKKSCNELYNILESLYILPNSAVDIYISVGDDNLIGKGIFFDLSDEVRKYITQAIICTINTWIEENKSRIEMEILNY